ncbi:MAG: pantoate--beta-alanine ligase, partial [Bacteroidota bacterium]
MKICTTIDEIICLLKDYRTKNIKTGMVPTMGALHAGHISLVEKSVSENDITIVSIFVNPIQFNNPKDLKNYPRTLEKDLEMLDKTKCDIIFSPNAKEMYPEKDNIQFNFGDLGSVMEGKFRPGHFNGVAIIVKKLFDIVKPDSAYFGKKDFQQLAIIKALVKEIKSPVRIVSCKTIREDDGLAMSSRNTLLSQEQRKKAPMIYKIL